MLPIIIIIIIIESYVAIVHCSEDILDSNFTVVGNETNSAWPLSFLSGLSVSSYFANS
jgi:hypothetical protein